MVHREVVNVSPHHIYADSVQYQSAAPVCSSTTSNITSYTVTRSNQMSQQPPQQSQPQPQPQQSIQMPPNQQHINVSNATNFTYSMQNLSLADNNVVYVNSEGIPIMRKSESDSASSGESIEDSTPPDTPLSVEVTNSSNVGGSSNNSSTNKKYKVHGDPKLSSRHKVFAQQQQQHQSQPPPQHIVFQGMIPSIPAPSDIVLPQNLSQQQPQQTQISQAQPNINSPTAMPGFSINNPPVLFQQYPPQSTHPIQKSQINTTYHYHTQHLPISNRGPILPTPNTTSSAPQSAVGTYRMPNGDLIYPFPSTMAYMQPATTLQPLAGPPPATSIQTHVVVPTPLPTIQHLPTITSLSSKTNQTAIISPFLLANETNKPITSCFNCGSSTHTGQECQERSIDDLTGGIYKLDYNSTMVNDSIKSSPELDNGSTGVKTSETITHIPPPVMNK